MPDTAKFWIVWKLDDPRPPTKRHADLDSATREAERLARQHRGRTFVVLEALATRTVDDMKRVELEAEPVKRDGGKWSAPYATVSGIRDAFGYAPFDGLNLGRPIAASNGRMSVPLNPSPTCPLCDPDFPGDDLPF